MLFQCLLCSVIPFFVTVPAFDVDSEQVSIIGVFYGGQNYEAILQDAAGDGC